MVKGMNMEKLKNNNKIAILSYLKTTGKSSRKKIAEELKLTTATLTILTNELIEENLVVELGALTEGKVGRKQILIDINKNARFSIGIEISKNNIYYNLINLKADIIESKSWEYSQKLEIEKLDEVIEYISKNLKNKNNLILGVGLSIYGGLTEEDKWKREIEDIKVIIQEKIKFKTIIQNNIRALALAEQYLNGTEKDFWLVKYGPGVGAAIIMNGRLVEGNKRMAGDIGHISFEKTGDICKVCGQRGCLESKVNFEKLLSKFDSKILLQNPISLNEKEFEYILRLSKLDNNINISLAIEKIAKAISIGSSILDSNKIILAGDILKDKDILDILKKDILNNNPILKKENIIFMEDYINKRKKASGILILNSFYNH
ncbi:ROK family protein [Cetobacterium sp.]|uniref:ROK family protein n=1 Tax=Cetobacterium sp. TaxID=2071632 RepID=UPI003F368219